MSQPCGSAPLHADRARHAAERRGVHDDRIALMDAYRLNDEARKHMMRHPHVTIEELPPEDHQGEATPDPAPVDTAQDAAP